VDLETLRSYCLVPHTAVRRVPVLSIHGKPNQYEDVSMTMVWIGLGIGLLVALARTVAWRQERGRQADLGFVSHQWVAEQRLARTQDARQ
jgi:hypothetical protein